MINVSYQMKMNFLFTTNQNLRGEIPSKLEFHRNEINLVWVNYFCTYGLMYNDLDCNRNNDYVTI